MSVCVTGREREKDRQNIAVRTNTQNFNNHLIRFICLVYVTNKCADNFQVSINNVIHAVTNVNISILNIRIHTIATMN